ncbi:MAG TPA: polysaccharide pyruvyl transferase CsaB [Clostridiales bacterium]|nr:polysaccharide pyruvyl transferase CsaB [Clostridiales bacterium]
MKVLHIIGGGDIGGAKAHVLSLVKELSKHIEVKLISLRHGPFAEDAKKMDIDVQVVKSGNLFSDLHLVRKTIEDEGFDILHSHGAKANMFSVMLKKKTGITTITTVHSDYRLDYLHSFFKRITYGTVNTIALRHIDYHIGVSNQFKNMLVHRKFDSERIYTVYNGIDFDIPKKQYERSQLIRKFQLPITDQDIIVGIAARLEPVKGIDTLIKAAAIVKKQNPHVKFLIGGDGDQKKHLVSLTKSLNLTDTVYFLGWLNDPYQLIAVTDISVLTSISESFPYAILEGVRYEKPTVSSAVGGIPDLIDHEENGFLFTPGNEEELAGYLLRLSSDCTMRQEMGRKIYEKASVHFSLKNMCSTQIDIYEKIAESKRTAKPKDTGSKQCDCVLLGYYGYNNIGDDALLSSICNNLKRFKPDINILALSRHPKETQEINQINAIYRFNLFKVIRSLKNAKLFAYGGGTLIQDSTSTRSLMYYLALMYLAKKMNLKTMLYANGIEPINKNINKKLTGNILNNVDVISLREDTSLKELEKLRITNPKIVVTADPAMTCTGIPAEEVPGIFKSEGIPVGAKYVGFSMRYWKGYGKKHISVMADLADTLYDQYRLVPVFIPMQHKYVDDCKISREIIAKMNEKGYLLSNKYTVSQTIGVISSMDLMIGMRLHSLIFSASQKVPMVGIAYEPKVDWFLRYIGLEDYCAGPAGKADINTLLTLCDKALKNKDLIHDMLEKRTDTLYEKCMYNAKLAIELMEDDSN